MSKKALVFLAPGAEEMECIITVDVLRRAGIEVIVTSLSDHVEPVTCSRLVNVVPDISLAEVPQRGPYHVMVLPGGLGGAKALSECKTVGTMLKEQEESGGYIAAICAAPTVLKTHKICEGKSLTSYPSVQNELDDFYKYLTDRVVVDGKLITSRGPGTAFEFALTIVRHIVNEKKADQVAKGLLLI